MPLLWVFYSSGISGILCVSSDSRFPCGLLLFFSNSRKDVDASLHGRRQKQEPQASPFALSDWNFSLLLSLYWYFHGGGFLVPRTRACCPYGVAELLTSKVLFKGVRRRCHATFITTFAPQGRGPQQPPLRSAATAQQLRTVGRVVCRRLCRQHAKVKLDKASQLVPADVIRYI